MIDRKKGSLILMVCACTALLAAAVLTQGSAEARQTPVNYLDQFNDRYGTQGTILDGCTVCHVGQAGGALNAYGSDVAVHGIGDLRGSETIDSDGDGYTNLTEIVNRTLPFDPESSPLTLEPLSSFFPFHALTIQKTCFEPVEAGTAGDCLIAVEHHDHYGDIHEINCLFDVLDTEGDGFGPLTECDCACLTGPDPAHPTGDDDVRNPPLPEINPEDVPYHERYLPIVAIVGNASCAVGDDGITAVLPCAVGPPGYKGEVACDCVGPDIGDPGRLPGDPLPGQIVFLSSGFPVEESYASPLRDQATALADDHCSSGHPDCSGNPAEDPPNILQQSSLTLLLECATDDDCNDGQFCNGVETCVNNSCVSGEPIVCEPDEDLCTDEYCNEVRNRCESRAPRDCSDSNRCTIDACNPDTGECEYEQRECGVGNACLDKYCDPARGCVTEKVECGDGDACTTDSCNPQVGCEYEDVDCDDRNACTDERCDRVDGCVYDDVECGDGNACTQEYCDPREGCVYEDIECNDGDACTEEYCDSVEGCVYEDIDCNDNNLCTDEICDSEEGCVYDEVTCDDQDPCTEDSCDPREGCIYTEIECPECGDGNLDPGEECDDGNLIDGDGCSAECTLERGEEGCTPGYWKQDQHFDSWVGYDPDDLFKDVFGVDYTLFKGQEGNFITLLEALDLGGGDCNALARHATAALLNASNPSVLYFWSPAEIISMTQFGFAEGCEQIKGPFELENERGCPLN